MDQRLEPFRRRNGSYLQLTSYRKDGRPVTTPVWCLVDNDRILMRTDSTSFKVKRMSRNPAVAIAPCNVRGDIKVEPIPARARELPGEAGRAIVKGYLRKYPIGYTWEVVVLRPLYALTSRFGIGKERGEPMFYELVPDDSPRPAEAPVGQDQGLLAVLGPLAIGAATGDPVWSDVALGLARLAGA